MVRRAVMEMIVMQEVRSTHRYPIRRGVAHHAGLHGGTPESGREQERKEVDVRALIVASVEGSDKAK